MALDRTTSVENIDPIIIDAGVVYKDYEETGETTLGVTRGGTTFSVTPEYKELERDGARGKEKGLKRLTNLSVQLSTNLMSLTKENMKDALGVADAGTDIINSKIDLEDSDYIGNIAVVGETMGGSYVVVIIKNALADEGIEISFEDREEAVLEVTFSAHFDPTAADNATYEDIFEIRYLDTFPEA